MTDREKRSLKIRLGRRLSSDRPEVMEIIKEEIDKTPKGIDDMSCEDCKFENRLAAQEPCCYCKHSHNSYFKWKGGTK